MESKIITLNQPGKIILPFAKEANVRPFATKTKPAERPIEQIAKETFDKMSEEDQEKVKANFEEKFGTDRLKRTAEQWQNLVGVYGLEQVAKIEKMTPKQVALKCGWKKSKSSQLKKK